MLDQVATAKLKVTNSVFQTTAFTHNLKADGSNPPSATNFLLESVSEKLENTYFAVSTVRRCASLAASANGANMPSYGAE